MSLTRTFADALQRAREVKGLSQEELARRAELDRTFVSQLERGLKSPTLTSIEKLASVLQVSPHKLLGPVDRRMDAPQFPRAYLLAPHAEISIKRERTNIPLDQRTITTMLAAIDDAHATIDGFYSTGLDIARLLELRNLSAFLGAVYAAAIVKASGDTFVGNPHQDGYPDLLLMDAEGRRQWDRLAPRRQEKSPFSPFPGGGIEIKATCGSVPTPSKCAARDQRRPGLGDPRIGAMTGYDWKAHHRKTNNLLGIVWDFVAGRPRIVAVFYSSTLEEQDWGAIVMPKVGGGKTTSVSIMTKSGISKMYAGWLCVLRDGGYASFFNKKNRASLIPER